MEIENYWPDFGKEIKHRFRYSIRFPSFMLYFVFVIIAIGMSGVFITIQREITAKKYNHDNVVLSLCTYFIALIASSSVELIISNKLEYQKAKKSMIVLGLISVLIGVGLFWCATVTERYYNYCISITGLIFALFIWWIANAYNQSLIATELEPIPPPGPLAGDVNKYQV